MAAHTNLVKQEEAATERSVQLRASDPGSPVTNQLWVNTTTNLIKYFSGSTITAKVADTRIVATYFISSPQSIGTGGSPTIVNYDASSLDTASAVTTGASWHFTAPETRNYLIMARFAFVSFHLANYFLYIFKNGSEFSKNLYSNNTGNSFSIQLSVDDIVPMTASDTLDIRAYQDSGASRLSQIADACQISIKAV